MRLSSTCNFLYDDRLMGGPHRDSKPPRRATLPGAVPGPRPAGDELSGPTRTEEGALPEHPVSRATDEGRVRGRGRGMASTRAKTGRHRRAGLVDGRYELEEMISKGGMGRVFRARHRDLGRKVALKLVLDGFQDDQELRELFFKEARLASSLAHPNIINVTDFGLDDELGYFVVMDLLEGETLRERMRQKRLTLRFIFEVLDQVAGAVRYIHGRDVVHCDLKPENIYLSKVEGEPRRSNQIKLLDFGLSWRRETMPDPKLGGTPPYLAPERLRGAPPSPLCDVYSLGMVLYELIAGQLPYSGTVSQLIEQQLTGPTPPPPSKLALEPLDERADALVMRALSRNPAHRHASAEAFQFELRAVIDMMGMRPARRPSAGATAQSSAALQAMKVPAPPAPAPVANTPSSLTSAEQARIVHLVTESPVPLAIFDLEGRVKLANRSFVETLEGVDIPIATFNELAITSRHPDVMAMFQRALDGHAPASRVVLAGAEGGERSTILWIAPFVEDGVVAGVHMTVVPTGQA